MSKIVGYKQFNIIIAVEFGEVIEKPMPLEEIVKRAREKT